METVALNAATLKVRRETWQGRQFLVAPGTLIVSGVLNGSQGPIFYGDDELAKDPSAWNGMPITVNHPSLDGKPVSARRPDILEKQGIGTVFEANHNGKLASELWFDVERTRKVDPRILSALEKGQPLELSTGLFLEQMPVPGVHNGREYQWTARNLRPDHLAILPDQKGACSIPDGCGVLVNAYPTTCPHCDQPMPEGKAPADGKCPHCGKQMPLMNEEATSLLSRLWRLLTGNKAMPSAAADVTPEKACQILKDGHANGHPLTQAQRGMFGAICGKRKDQTHNTEGDPEPWVCSVCNTDHEDAGMAESVANCGGKGGKPGPCATGGGGGDPDYGHPGVARRLAAATTPREKLKVLHESATHLTDAMVAGRFPDSGPAMLKEHVYSLAGQLSHADAKALAAEMEIRAPKTHAERVKAIASKVHQRIGMAQRSSDQDFGDAKAKKAAEARIKADNTDHGDSNMKFNEAQRAAIITELTTNCDCWKAAGDREVLNGFSDEKLAALKQHAEEERQRVAVVNTMATVLGTTELVANADTMSAAMMAQCKKMMAGEKAEKMADNATTPTRPQTDAEWLATAPQGIQGAVRNAMKIEQREKSRLVERLVANVAADRRQARAQALMSKSLEELNDLLELLPQAPTTNHEQVFSNPDPLYLGAGGAPVANHQDDSDRLLPVQVVNFEEMASPKLRRAQ